MAAFEYRALDAQGQKKKGTVEADTPRQARQQLRDQGLSPLSINQVEHKHKSPKQHFLGGPRLAKRDLTLITRQIATLIRSGLPLDEVLGAVSQQTEKRGSQRVLLALRGRVLEGLSLADACRQFPNAFPPLYHATIAAGESSGKLDEVLERLADHLEAQEEIRQKVQLALIYPVLLTVLSLLIVVGLLTYVVPEIVGVFDSLGQELPILTLWLIKTSDFFQEYLLAILLLLLAMWVVFRILLRIDTFRLNLHGALLRIPLVGRFSKYSNAARFARTLAILTGSGVELLEALRIAGLVIPNIAIRTAVEHAAIKVREGASLSRTLEQSNLFPPITIHLIASGETSGQLDRMLKSAADTQEREIQSQTAMLLGIFEPALILLMGGVVLIIVISILLPIFEMNQLVR